jgi:lysylphosphatidylglycerol synthetase-like protein (DUF2156 family)
VKEAQGGDVLVVSMGPQNAQDSARKALAMGADSALLITDDGAAGSDLVATTNALAAALEPEAPDLVLFGQQSSDSDGAVLWGVIIFGILILLFGPADGPAAILGVLAFLSAFVMGAYCLLLLLTNNMLLPRKIRPNIVISVILAFGGLFYLGLLFYSIFAYGALPD